MPRLRVGDIDLAYEVCGDGTPLLLVMGLGGDRQGWELAPDNAQRQVLARALDALDDVGHPVSDELLNRYADAMRPVAAHEVASVRSPDREASAEAAVVGTLLQEPILLAVRRIAQENASRELA